MPENKSNIYTQTGSNSQQIGIQNNYCSQNLKINLIYNKKNILANTKELLTNLLCLNNDFDFKIIGLNKYFSNETLKDYCLELKIIYFKNKQVNKDWDEKDIREFIYQVKDIESFTNLFKNIEEERLNNFINILTNFLINEKVNENIIPNIFDLRLALRFYRQNKDFDFIKVIGYEFNDKLKIYELVNIIQKKYNKSIDILKKVRNLNKDVLELFFNSNDSINWTIDNLYNWLGEDDKLQLVKSNLNEIHVNSIEDLFKFALNQHFIDEDIGEWLKLKEYYLKSFNNPIIHPRLNTTNMSSKELVNNLYDLSDNISYLIDKMKNKS